MSFFDIESLWNSQRLKSHKRCVVKDNLFVSFCKDLIYWLSCYHTHTCFDSWPLLKSPCDVTPLNSEYSSLWQKGQWIPNTRDNQLSCYQIACQTCRRVSDRQTSWSETMPCDSALVLKIVLLAKSINELRKSSSDIENLPCDCLAVRVSEDAQGCTVVWRTSKCTTGSESAHVTMQAGVIVNTHGTWY